MSETWNTDSSSSGEWSTSQRPASSPVGPRYTHVFKFDRDGNRTALRFSNCGISIAGHGGFVASDGSVDEATALSVIAEWNKQSGGFYTYSLDTSSTSSPANGGGNTNAQRSTPKMKLTFSRTALIGSIKASIQKRVDAFTEKQTAFDAEMATATSVAEANAASLAKAAGFDDVDAFKKSPSFKISVDTIKRALGLNTPKPSKPVTTSEDSLIATLSLASDETLEIEEGHPFLAHLG